MRIKIKEQAQQFNCHWYCTEVGKKFKVDYFDEKLGCYVVLIRKQKYLVSKNHAELLNP